MDTNAIIADMKARFAHNAAKIYLAEKYNSKLIVASQGGLWKADAQTISLLSVSSAPSMILADTFNNPVLVNRVELLELLGSTYTLVMNEWHKEWLELEIKR